MQIEGFYRKKGGARELLTEEETSFLGGAGRVIIQMACFCGEMERAHVTDYYIGVDQKIPDWLIKVMFLGEVETVVRSGIKSRFGIMGF